MRYAAALLAVALTLAPSRGLAFRNVKPGDAVPNRKMKTLRGATAPLLATSSVSVLVFFRPAQEHSLEGLRATAQLAQELAGKPVRFVAIASDSYPRERMSRTIAQAGAHVPVLVDARDGLYGQLGVALHPVVAIVDARGRLSGYQPFRKINFLESTRARIQLALGEIGEAELEAILDPPAAPVASGGRAHARVGLARAMLAARQIDRAVAEARAAIALDATLSEAHAVLAEGLAAAGNCAESERERDEAQRLASVQVAFAACAPR